MIILLGMQLTHTILTLLSLSGYCVLETSSGIYMELIYLKNNIAD